MLQYLQFKMVLIYHSLNIKYWQDYLLNSTTSICEHSKCYLWPLKTFSLVTERSELFCFVFQAWAVQKQKSELCPRRIWELLESRMTQSFHFKYNLPLKQAHHCYWTLLLASDHTLRACSRWRKTCSCVGNLVFRREVSTETSMRLLVWRLDNETWTGWMMSTELLGVSYNRPESHKVKWVCSGYDTACFVLHSY